MVDEIQPERDHPSYALNIPFLSYKPGQGYLFQDKRLYNFIRSQGQNREGRVLHITHLQMSAALMGNRKGRITAGVKRLYVK